MTRCGAALLLVFGFGSVPLHAAIPPYVVSLTPTDGATKVPTDFVVSIAIAGTEVNPNIELFEARTQTLVPGKTERTRPWADPIPPRPPGVVGGSYESGATYVFTPAKPLQPRTRYEVRCWRGKAGPAGLGCPSYFTTGDGPAKPGPGPSN